MTDETSRKRRRRALAGLAAVAGAAGALVGAAAGGEDARPAQTAQDVSATLQDLTPAQQAGSVVVLQFQGTSAPSYVRAALRERRAAGVILFGHNIASPQQLRRLTRTLQRAGRGRALIMTDQEGGEIRNIRWAPPRVSPAAVRTEAAARANGRAAARALRAHGLNVNLAPVADVATRPDSVMRARAFPGDGRRVARLVRANLRGYAGTGVLPTVKHFPGLGGTAVNTDFGLATVDRLGAGDLAPFRAAIEDDVPLVMSSHALYPQLDRRRIASQSPVIMRDLLRERLGFEGVTITDSLAAEAVVRRTSTATAAVRSMAAGNDLLLLTGRASFLRVSRRLVREARRSEDFRARLGEALVRIEALRRRLREP